MFKFSFQPIELNEEFANGCTVPGNNTTFDNNETNDIPCADFDQVFPQTEQMCKSTTSLKYGTMRFAGGPEVVHLKSDVLIKDLVEDQIHKRLEEERLALADQGLPPQSETDSHTTDLVPGVYEGGGKIWECTQDLGDYLTRNSNDKQQDNLFSDISGQYVLDLGCGAGILGILALQSGANVHFQDYNREIMSKVTIQNVILNSKGDKHRLLNRCKFYSGDWTKYVEATEQGPQFDIIVTCETIYNPANNYKILKALKAKLRDGTGVAYLAAKTYYFGVGGGLRAFEALIENDGTLVSEVVWITTENVQREILKITHKQTNESY